jgi:hypothetical protein
MKILQTEFFRLENVQRKFYKLKILLNFKRLVSKTGVLKLNASNMPFSKQKKPAKTISFSHTLFNYPRRKNPTTLINILQLFAKFYIIKIFI